MLGWLVKQTPEQRHIAMADAARTVAASYVPPLPPRPVGRPAKRQVVELESLGPLEESEQKRRKYVQWFSTPFIHDILAAYKNCNYSARATIAYLQRSHPTQYADLSESTLRSWFDASSGTHKLHPQFEMLLITREYIGGPGRARAFDACPEAEHQIMDVLMKMRSDAAGAAVNIETIRWVMQSITRHYAGLAHLKLSRGFISNLCVHPNACYKLDAREDVVVLPTLDNNRVQAARGLAPARH
jgi:hypothetical protein